MRDFGPRLRLEAEFVVRISVLLFLIGLALTASLIYLHQGLVAPLESATADGDLPNLLALSTLALAIATFAIILQNQSIRREARRPHLGAVTTNEPREKFAVVLEGGAGSKILLQNYGQGIAFDVVVLASSVNRKEWVSGGMTDKWAELDRITHTNEIARTGVPAQPPGREYRIALYSDDPEEAAGGLDTSKVRDHQILCLDVHCRDSSGASVPVTRMYFMDKADPWNPGKHVSKWVELAPSGFWELHSSGRV